MQPQDALIGAKLREVKATVQEHNAHRKAMLLRGLLRADDDGEVVSTESGNDSFDFEEFDEEYDEEYDEEDDEEGAWT